MERWSGRVALVTGASEGIGRGVAIKLAGHGMKVVVCARSDIKLKEATDEVKKSGVTGELFPIRCDLRNEEEILAMFKTIKDKYGGIDVCVNNAGICNDASLLNGSTEGWNDMLKVNVLALLICSRESIKSMRERNIDDGQIIHISSMSGHRLVDNFVYSCTKQAVRALTEGLRVELRQIKSHIRVASISPANVSTEMIRRIVPISPFKELEVSDIVDAAIYILSAPAHAQVHDVLIRAVEQDS